MILARQPELTDGALMVLRADIVKQGKLCSMCELDISRSPRQPFHAKFPTEAKLKFVVVDYF